MKKTILSLAIAMVGHGSYGQNVFPTPIGNVGIGTTSPTTLLDVYNSANSAKTILRISGTAEAGGNYTALLLGAGGLQGRGKGGVLFEPWGTTYGFGRLHFAVNETAGEGEATLSDVKMTILGNGSVGIGTTLPGSLLQINGVTSMRTNTSTDGYISINPGSSTCQGYINWWKPGGIRVGYMGYTDGSTVNNLALTLEASANFIINGGNVLIGKTSEQPGADYKLDIVGSARADKIVVNTTGADFVFDKKYTLPKLSDVKAYIDKNQHLPEIPSAKEMQANGMSIGEINTKLLQKVEELTLYMIELQKQNANLKMELIRTKTRNHLK
ncbi:MAG TPA: hypothetical protein VL442_01830 [Mucilaginibacter sp.]|jgi:hypothetical protein|nr:hypothetical protein [Mucilaginibacter sp.]